jgi:hypothetical protein
MLTFDHIAFSAEVLSQGVAEAEAALGVGFAGGGTHEAMGTHNRLLGLGDLYLEVIAIDPQAAPPGHPRWFDLDRFEGGLRLTNWVARCDDLDRALALCPAGVGPPLALSRGDYRWRISVPEDGRQPFDGCFPALLQWQSTARPTAALPDSGLRLRRLKITHPRAGDLVAALAPLLADDRVEIGHGPEPRMEALFAGPEGDIWIS